MNPKPFWKAAAVSVFAMGLLASAQQNTLEANKNVVRQFQAAVNAQNLAAFDTLVAPNIVDHNPSPGQKQDLAGFKESFKPFFAAFPDLKVGLDADLVAEGDMVAYRWTLRGTQTGELRGIPPTGKFAVMDGITIMRVEDGKIVAGWHSYDMLGLLRQSGWVPAPG
jgi:steroid delta-isomerase-like uncharacterized protein